MDTNNSITLVAKDLGIENLPIDAQKEIVTTLGEVALKNALVEIIGKLPEELLPEFEKISGEGDVEKARYFLRKNIPQYDQLMKNEVKKVAEDFKRIQKANS